MNFKPEDKFIFEIGDRQKIDLLKKFIQYNSISQIITFIDKMKTIFNLLSDEEIDEYNDIYNNKPTKDFVKWINQKYEEYQNIIDKLSKISN